MDLQEVLRGISDAIKAREAAKTKGEQPPPFYTSTGFLVPPLPSCFRHGFVHNLLDIARLPCLTDQRPKLEVEKEDSDSEEENGNKKKKKAKTTHTRTAAAKAKRRRAYKDRKRAKAEAEAVGASESQASSSKMAQESLPLFSTLVRRPAPVPLPFRTATKDE